MLLMWRLTMWLLGFSGTTANAGGSGAEPLTSLEPVLEAWVSEANPAL